MKSCMISVLTLAFGITLSAAAPAKAPLVQNAGFEKMAGKNPADWVCVVPANGLTVNGEAGQKVLKLAKSGTGACMVVQRNLPLAADKSYAVSCSVRSTDQGTGMVYVEYRAKQPDGKYKHTSVNARAIHGKEDWTEVLFEVSPRAKECEAPYIVLMTTANSMEFRNLKITELD